MLTTLFTATIFAMADKPSISKKSRRRGSNNRRQCCVPGCSSSGYRDPNRRLSFHLFPVDKEVRKEWVISIFGQEEGPDIKIGGTTCVCCDHFLPSDIKKGLSGTRMGLRKGAVPCIFDSIDTSQPKKKTSQKKGTTCPKKAPSSVHVTTVETKTGEASQLAPILSDHDYASTVSGEAQLKSNAEDANSESDVANTYNKMQTGTSLANNTVSTPIRKEFNCHSVKTEPGFNNDVKMSFQQKDSDETNYYSDDEYELPLTFSVSVDLRKTTGVPNEGKRNIHNDNRFQSKTDARMRDAERSETTSVTNMNQDQLSRHKQNEEEPPHKFPNSDLATSSGKTALGASPSPRTTTSDKSMLTPRANVSNLPTTSRDNRTTLTTSPTATAHVCEVCNESFACSSTLNSHLLTHNEPKPFQCDECDMSFTYDFELSRHIRVHIGYKPFACQLCPKAFRLPHSLKKHQLIHLGQKPFPCDLCDKSFLEARNLAAHKLDHTGVRLFECDVCSKKFLTKANLKKHALIHSCAKEFQCDVCGKSFTQFSSLKLHKLVHSQDKAFACDLCDRTFNFKGSLSKHKEYHLEQKHHQCDVCFEFFSLPEILKKHKLIHMGNDETLECKVCQKRYAHANSLKSHMLLHSEQNKLFVCEVCHWQFSRRGSLKEHMKVHTGEKPHVCEVCDERFTWKNGLTKHMLIHGPENVLALK